MNLVKKAGILALSLGMSTLAMADMSGSWNLSVTTEAGSGNPSFDIAEDNGQLTGKYNGQLGQADITGSVEDGKFVITYTADGMGQAIEIKYSGELKGDGTIAGTLDLGGMGSGTFTGTKK